MKMNPAGFTARFDTPGVSPILVSIDESSPPTIKIGNDDETGQHIPIREWKEFADAVQGIIRAWEAE